MNQKVDYLSDEVILAIANAMVDTVLRHERYESAELCGRKIGRGAAVCKRPVIERVVIGPFYGSGNCGEEDCFDYGDGCRPYEEHLLRQQAVKKLLASPRLRAVVEQFLQEDFILQELSSEPGV